MTPNEQVDRWLERFALRCATRDSEDIAPLFTEACIWRDRLAFTWNMKSTEGLTAIGDMMAATLAVVEPVEIKRTDDAVNMGDTIEAWFSFETKHGRGKGHVRLDGGKCSTLYTALQELKGFEEKRGKTRPLGTFHGATKSRDNWGQERNERHEALGITKQPYVLIIGGGQCGVALAARLKQLDVPTLIVEKNQRAGDNWRKRYASLCLHDPVQMNHFPYLPFPDTYPTFLPKDMLGNFIESYVQLMDLNYWTDATCNKAKYDEASGTWQVKVTRAGKEITLNPTHVVLATGMSGFPNQPIFEGQDIFKGEQQHSSEHPGPENYKGKKVVIVGSNNSAHDIAAALWENDADVTMLQRSPTTVLRSDSFVQHMIAPLFSDEAVAAGVTHEVADDMLATIPFKQLTEAQKLLCTAVSEQDADFYAGLAEAGFRHDFGDDNTGLFMKYLRRGSGYYIDVGASQLVIDGKIKVVQGQMQSLTENAVIMEDGTEVTADLVVYATGYGPMNNWIEAIIDKETAEKVGQIWGIGSGFGNDQGPWEGELKNIAKPTPQDGFWIMATNLGLSRPYSLFLALQLKARMEGLETPVYSG